MVVKSSSDFVSTVTKFDSLEISVSDLSAKSSVLISFDLIELSNLEFVVICEETK